MDESEIGFSLKMTKQGHLRGIMSLINLINVLATPTSLFPLIYHQHLNNLLQQCTT